MRKTSLRAAFAALTIAVAVMTGAIFGSGGPRPALAAPCGSTECLRVDAVAGGPVDTTASAGWSFDVDVYAAYFNPGGLGTFRFVLEYDATLLSASVPSTGGLSTSLFNCPSADADLPEGHAFADGDPGTGEVFMYCDGLGAAAPDGPIARITFTSLAAGSSNLILHDVQVGDTTGTEIMSCHPLIVNPGGGCTTATVTFTAPPALPPPPVAPCAVQFAISGHRVQCLDGRTVRMIGVGSPVGAQAGAAWATAVTNWFLAGKTITLETDSVLSSGGDTLAYAHVIGTDSNDYNMSALLIYVGMARYTPDPPNLMYDGWLSAAHTWAKTACWNMWDAGNPWAGESGC